MCFCCCDMNVPENIRVHRRNFGTVIDGMQSGKRNIRESERKPLSDAERKTVKVLDTGG